MSINRYEPWYLMSRLQHDLDRLLTPAAPDDEPQHAVIDWVPAVDIHQQDRQFVIHADLPGVDPKNIEITLENCVLTIRGRRELAPRTQQEGFRTIERAGGEFFRRFSLPDTTDSQAVTARHANCVLEVAIPKQAQVLPRRAEAEAA